MPSGGLQNHSAVVCVCGVLSFFGSHVSGNLLLFCMAAPLVGYVMWRKMKDSTGWWNLREISKWFMSVHICILCHLSHASAAVFREGHQWWGSKIIGIYRVPLPLHHPVFLPPTHFVSLPVVWWEADRWQSHFHSGTAIWGLSHAIAISVTLNPSQGDGDGRVTEKPFTTAIIYASVGDTHR